MVWLGLAFFIRKSVKLGLSHCSDERVASGGLERVCLQLVMVHDSVPFMIDPCLLEHAGPQFPVFVEFHLFLHNWPVVFGIQRLFGFLELTRF
jgi:hypothetical protein